MKNTEILGINPLPQNSEPVADERQQLIDERLQFEKEEHERLAKAGADYGGRETLRAFFQRCGRF